MTSIFDFRSTLLIWSIFRRTIKILAPIPLIVQCYSVLMVVTLLYITRNSFCGKVCLGLKKCRFRLRDQLKKILLPATVPGVTKSFSHSYYLAPWTETVKGGSRGSEWKWTPGRFLIQIAAINRGVLYCLFSVKFHVNVS